jgi:nicotinamide-nucleotide amidase
MQALVKDVSTKLRAKGWNLVTAESCTGGMIAAAMTDLAGSSDVFERGFVTYSNQAKMDCLGVSEATLQKHGAVSEQTAIEMAQGALDNSLANVSIAVTGIAGPGGGTPGKPVGLVYIGYGIKGGDVQAKAFNFPDMTRDEVRQNTVKEALEIALSILNEGNPQGIKP